MSDSMNHNGNGQHGGNGHDDDGASRPPQFPPSKNLSDIGHLFLSSVRQRQTNDSPRPHRRPPGQHQQPPSERPQASIDLTPEEFGQVFGGEDALRLDASDGLLDDHAGRHDARDDDGDARTGAPVTAVLAHHFNGRQIDRVRTYARHLAGTGRKRVGLIEVDASEFRLTCFDGHAHTEIVSADGGGEPQAHLQLESFDARQMTEAIEELGWDVERWLLLLPSPRLPEARALLRMARHWVLLSTCDHDGVVSAYRTLKGLTEDAERDDHAAAAGNGSAASHRPRVSLSVLDARDTLSAERVYRKLAGVCEQFLSWPVDREDPVTPWTGANVAEHLVLCCRPTRDKSQLAGGVQWQTVADLLDKARNDDGGGDDDAHHHEHARPADARPAREDEPMQQQTTRPSTYVSAEPHYGHNGHAAHEPLVSPEESQHFRDPIIEDPTPAVAAVAPVAVNAAAPVAGSNAADEVIELVGPDATESSILASVLRHDLGAGQLVECPIVPPMRVTAKLAIRRDRRVVLMAVARQGLSDLRSIGQAYRWLVENRALIAMAVPQMAIDAHAMPHLTLLVDQSDLTAELLQPLLEAGHVAVRTYRKLRWGGRTGLLLEAA